MANESPLSLPTTSVVAGPWAQRPPDPVAPDIDIPRPPPPRSWRERLVDAVRVPTRALVARVAPGQLPLGQLLIAAGSVLLVVAGAVWLLRAPVPPVESSLPRASSATTTAATVSAVPPAGSPSAGLAPSGGADVVVQAAGAVVAPGVYRLPAGARVTDLIVAAGGPQPGVDTSVLSLAAKLVDGQRVYLPRPGEAVPPPPAPGADSATPAGPVNLNTGTLAELDTLPGVGPSTAAAIVAFREKNGPFRSVDALGDVPGIGDVRLAALRDLVTV